VNICRDFILKNQSYFEARLQESTTDRIMIMGFIVGTVKDSFEELLESNGEKLLPYCLYLIQLGLGVSEDKQFSMSAFEELLPTSKAYADLPTLAYIYAYCLNHEGDLEKSELVINVLAETNFPPAIVTQGDLSWLHKHYRVSKSHYLKAASGGHYIAKQTLLRLFGRKKHLILRFWEALLMIKDTTIRNYPVEKYLYLNFYRLNRKKRIVFNSES